MRKLLSTFLFVAVLSFCKGQGCSDAGVCTIGDFNKHFGNYIRDEKFIKRQLSFAFNYGTHGNNERFYQPLLNYRYNRKNKSFFEVKVPVNIAKDKTAHISNVGLGDVTITYNNYFKLPKEKFIQYSAGLRISMTSANDGSPDSLFSYPMFLQPGLGTLDILAAANYRLKKFISIGAGIQYPLINYNDNEIQFADKSGQIIVGKGFHRKPDALFKITGHYEHQKIKVDAGGVSIFHLGKDYYNTVSGKYEFDGSKGYTLNWTVEFAYKHSDKWTFSILYAEPFKTRDEIPDGLARSRVISPKITYSLL